MKGIQVPPLGLRGFLLSLVLCAIVIPAVAIGYLLTSQIYEKAVFKDPREQAEKYADILQAGMALSLWNLAPDSGQQLIAGASLNPSVLRITVTDSWGKTFLVYNSPSANTASQFIRLTRRVHHELRDIGKVELTYSLEAARRQIHYFALQIAGIIAAQAVGSIVLLGIFLNRRVLRPVRLLGEAVAVITESDLDAPIPTLAADEFGQLAAKFRTMRNTLKKGFASLEEEIGERTRANAEIQLLNAQLEDRVAARTAELSSLNSELAGTLEQLRSTQKSLIQSEKLAALGALVAGVAHELNTPLGNALAAATTLEHAAQEMRTRYDSGLKRSELDRFLDTVEEGSALTHSSLERAATLVDSFKQLAVTQIAERRRQFDLAEALEVSLITMNSFLRDTGYSLKIDVPHGIYMDSFPGPLTQVLASLFSNAVNHGLEGRRTGSISIVATQVDAEHIKFEFADDGRGIAENDLPRIFDPFYTTKLGHGSSGLGLHIVHNVVSSILGGTIEVASTVGNGARFTIVLPVCAPTEA